MAITNLDRVGRGLELLRDGLQPYVERELQGKFGAGWETEVKVALGDKRVGKGKAGVLADSAALLPLMDKLWGQVFGAALGRSERNLVLELADVRNKWAHQEPFRGDDVDRALDSMERLLSAVSATQAEDVRKIKVELRRLIFDEQVRNEKKKGAGTPIEGAASANLKPWREVITPHADVAKGTYQQAEFAADLWQVYLGKGSGEYTEPVEFFRRTYLTDSLKEMLANAVRRLNGKGGDPVIQLQTNFGGGKTHSMVALYHLFSGVNPAEMPGLDDVLKAADLAQVPKANRVVLVGNKLSPGNPVTKADGTVVRTLWGELAWQLGGKQAFKRIQADDERATSPGDALRELLIEYGPCLILIDEWVAYARQLHEQSDLPGGSFETQFTFAQALSEAAKAAKNCLLVISLPASDTAASPHTQAEDIEVGGQRGREALGRLQNVVGRLESSWRPATAEESFAIVRRRLFESIPGSAYRDRDVTARAFADLYRDQQAEFPPECREAEYEKRLKEAYPIHPEIFDRLYSDWSTLVKFQRTRGVLRLMAAVIHSLWEKGDRNPLILPANIPIDDPRVQSELTRYLSDNWAPVIEKDVDGSNSLPLKIDAEQSATLGKLQATRRVARTIYLGSAPTAGAANRGLEDRRVKLGCAMPGESVPVFGDALRRLAASATFLYHDGARYWYSTQPTVTKLADDRAEQYKRDPDRIHREMERRIRENLARAGDFRRLHPMPASGHDVPDELTVGLVVLGPDHPYSRDKESPALALAESILQSRGNSPRLHRNALVFLAPDKTRLQDLEEATRRYLAWDSIVAEKEGLDLTPQQVRQAETQRTSADGAVKARIPETYQWLLVPEQANPTAPVTWEASKLTGQEPLAERALKRLRSEELMVAKLGPSVLRGQLDKIPLWRNGRDVSVAQLASDFAQYLYLQRLDGPHVLRDAIEAGCGLATWAQDSWAYADDWDEADKRYRGLRTGQRVTIPDVHSAGLLVRPDIARAQLEAERSEEPVPPSGGEATPVDQPGPKRPGEPAAPRMPTSYHGTVELNASRVGRDAGRIAEEIISHLAGLVGSEVTVSLEIHARIPKGVPDAVVRTVTENGRTLKFTNQGFEVE
jgi:predicted AAA+ superfamily ATPase